MRKKGATMQAARVLLIIWFALAGAGGAIGGDTGGEDGGSPPRQISVHGEATVSAAPDMAVLYLGANVQAKRADAAARELGETLAQIMAALARSGIAPEDIQTNRLEMRPLWSDRGAGNTPPKITGFAAQSLLRVQVFDLDALPGLLDSVISSGANQIEGLRFEVRDAAGLMDAARRAAVLDAGQKAAVMASTAGVGLGPLISLQEQGGQGPPGQAMTLREAAMPVARGQLEFRAAVSAVFALR